MWFGIVLVGGVFLVSKSGLDIVSLKASKFLMNPIHIEFLLGMMLGYIWLKGSVNRLTTTASLLCAIILFGSGIYVGIMSDYHHLGELERVIYYGFGSFFLIYALLYFEKSNQIVQSERFKLLGDSSYAIYLLHVPIIYILNTSKVFWNLKVININIVMMAYLIFLCTLSVIYFKKIERPLYILVKGKTFALIKLIAKTPKDQTASSHT